MSKTKQKPHGRGGYAVRERKEKEKRRCRDDTANVGNGQWMGPKTGKEELKVETALELVFFSFFSTKVNDRRYLPNLA